MAFSENTLPFSFEMFKLLLKAIDFLSEYSSSKIINSKDYKDRWVGSNF